MSSVKIREDLKNNTKEGDTFGKMVPYGDPTWYQQWHSPYYNETHKHYRKAIREWSQAHIDPFADEWERAGEMPFKEIVKAAGNANILAGVCGLPWPTEHVGTKIPGGILPTDFDNFHELILFDELSHCGSYSAGCGWYSGLTIALPPVRKFGSAELQQHVVGPCFRGDKIISLAITEPYAGSDVANLKCEAKKTEDGKFYIVNGEKKWITNGIYADFFVTAVRTGQEGRNGISVLLIERSPGVKTQKMQCMGLGPSGTTFVIFDDVRVPVKNLLGKENDGFRIIMHNFNHERLQCVAVANRLSRVCYEEAFLYAHKRQTFGKKLIEHPVIREKFSHMIRLIETTHALTESVVYQMLKMTEEEAAQKLGGITALLKAQSTRQFEFCAREASQVFGGLAYTKGGQGAKIERMFREARAFTVFAGSEEIMLDLAVRQSMRDYEKNKAKL